MVAMEKQDNNSPGNTSRAVLASDTSPEAQRIQVALWRRMSPIEKAQTVGRISRNVRQLSLAGIRQRHPLASERECEMRFAILTLGRTLASKAYPDFVSGS
jgi:putative SOS response-associated peptidase YedK